PERIVPSSARFSGGNRERKSTFCGRGVSALNSAANAWLAATSRLVGVSTIAQGTPARRRWPSISREPLGPSPPSGWAIHEIIGHDLCALDSRAWNAGAERAAGTGLVGLCRFSMSVNPSSAGQSVRVTGLSHLYP